MGRHRSGRSSTITDGDLDHAVVERPGELHVCAGKRPGMPDGVTEQLTHDQDGVADGALEDSCRRQFGGQALTANGNARRRVRQEYCPRCSHLPAQTAWNVRLVCKSRCGGDAQPQVAGNRQLVACAQVRLAAFGGRLAGQPLGCEPPDKTAQTGHQPGPLVGRQLVQDPSLA